MDHARLHKLAIARTLCIAALALAVASCHRSNGPEDSGFHPYAIRHATLHFEYVGQARGTVILYIDSFGIAEARWEHADFQAKDGFRNTTTYTVKHRSQVTIVDSGKQAEIRIKDEHLDSLYHLDKSAVPTPEQVFGDDFLKLRYHVVRDTVVAGLHAKLWQQETQPMFVMESGGLIVGNQIGPAGLGFELRLVSIDTISPIDPSKFIANSNYPIQKITSGGPRLGSPH